MQCLAHDGDELGCDGRCEIEATLAGDPFQRQHGCQCQLRLLKPRNDKGEEGADKIWIINEPLGQSANGVDYRLGHVLVRHVQLGQDGGNLCCFSKEKRVNK